MSVKFRIGFTITGEALFGLVAKMGLPIEDLEVEEMGPNPMLTERAIAIHKLMHKPKQKRASPGPNLKKGINSIVMMALSDGPKRPIDMHPKLKAAGFSPNSITSRLEKLSSFGAVERVGDGRWKIKDETLEKLK
jgi:hypothetical protein